MRLLTLRIRPGADHRFVTAGIAVQARAVGRLSALSVLAAGILLTTGCTGEGPDQGVAPEVAAGTSTATVTAPARAAPARRGALCLGRRPTVVGTAGADTVRGTRRRDTIATLAGNDRITGLRADDVVCAGPGEDEVADVDGFGARIKLGPGHDRFSAHRYAVLLAGPGDDRIVLSLERYSDFEVHLGPGDDRLVARRRPGHRSPEFGGVCVSYEFARRPVDVDLGRGVARGEGHDRLTGVRCVHGSPRRDHIVGSSAADYIEDSRGPLTVETGGGNDYVNGSQDRDLAVLGQGDDTFHGAGGADRASGGAGEDLLNGDDGVDVLHGGAGDDEVNGAYFCHSNSDLLPVSDGSPNALYGGPGDDYLIGDIGNDLLDGGPGTDRGFGQEDGLLDTLVSLERPTMC